jgi:hypothetical protein
VHLLSSSNSPFYRAGQSFALLLVLVIFCSLELGCSLLPSTKRAQARPSFSSSPLPTPTGTSHKNWHLLPHFSLNFLFPHHKSPPPKAQVLLPVGIIRTVAQDGSYVIIELEPGIMIPPGRILFVTASAGEPVRLRAAENQPPYFIADVESGHPTPGQSVQQ